MTPQELLLLGIIGSSFVTGAVIFFLDETSRRLRTWLNLLGAGVKVVLVVSLLQGFYGGDTYTLEKTIAPGLTLLISADGLSVLFVTLSTILWFFTTLYAVGYLESSHHRSRFFGFFSMCVSATTGLAFAGNLFTFIVFYELLTVSTVPLIVHTGTAAAIRSGRTYLAYTLAGGTAVVAAGVWLQALVGPTDFSSTAKVAAAALESPLQLSVIFLILFCGFGVKAAIVPFHGWLPKAMVAPAPVSSLLHAVAVVKAGAFGIVRLVYDVYGIETAQSLGMLAVMAVVASITIVYGSVRALFEDELKKRLAYSTVSQVSYIVLGTAVFGPLATIGGVVHLVHQGIMKITLFFCAGNYAETVGVKRVSEMNGIGKRMPWTTGAFTVGALGMIGVPPFAGAVSKWYLKKGSVDAGMEWVGIVLAISSLLNAAYFLPILYRAWFLERAEPWSDKIPAGRLETRWMLLVPPVVTALLVVYAGLLAESGYSPLAWAKMIAETKYPR